MENNFCIVSYNDIRCIWNWIWPYLVGYGYSISVGGFFIKATFNELKKKLKFHDYNEDEIKASSWYARRVGDIEIVLYITAFLISKPEFIAVWLALKVAGRWQSAQLEAEEAKAEKNNLLKDKTAITNPKEGKFKFIQNNGVYNVFTIGNALSIVYAFAGSKIIFWLKDLKWGRAIVLIFIVFIGHTVLDRMARKQTERLEKILKRTQ